MDLNFSPNEEDGEEFSVEIDCREREERLKRKRNDERLTHARYDNSYQRTYDESKLLPGWLNCPSMGQEIYGIIPSKVPLSESFSHCIPPGRRYSFKQVFTKAKDLGKRGWDDLYVPRTHEGLLKWKYGNMNSVDFLFEIVDDRWLLYCFETGKKKLILLFGKIYECSWDSEKSTWVYMRMRPDKSTPNDIKTYTKVERARVEAEAKVKALRKH